MLDTKELNVTTVTSPGCDNGSYGHFSSLKAWFYTLKVARNLMAANKVNLHQSTMAAEMRCADDERDLDL